MFRNHLRLPTISIVMRGSANLFDPEMHRSTNRSTINNYSKIQARSVVTQLFGNKTPSDEPPTRLRIFSGYVVAVFAVDTALRFPRRRFSSAYFRLLSSRVHSRLLRGTRLSFTSNPKATHRHGERRGKHSVFTRYVLIACQIHRSFTVDICTTTAPMFNGRKCVSDRRISNNQCNRY